jgi:hypothetical protein
MRYSAFFFIRKSTVRSVVPNDNMILSTTVTPVIQPAWSEGVYVM